MKNLKTLEFYSLPDYISMDEGALIEPWVVGVYAVKRSGITVGQKCVIIGAGAIGILVFLAAKLAGAVKICIVGKCQAQWCLVHQLFQKEIISCKK